MQKQKGLDVLIHDNPKARSYYHDLPDHIRIEIASHGNEVHSLDGLQHYAELLLKSGE